MNRIKKEEISELIEQQFSAAKNEVDKQLPVNHKEKRRAMFDAVEILEREIRREIRRACGSEGIDKPEELDTLLDRFNEPLRRAINSIKGQYDERGKIIINNTVSDVTHNIRAAFSHLYAPTAPAAVIIQNEVSFNASLKAVLNKEENDELNIDQAAAAFTRKIMSIVAEHFVSDFLKYLAAAKELNVNEKFSINQVDDIIKAFKNFRSFFAGVVVSKLEDNPDITFLELKNHIVDAIKDFQPVFKLLPKEAVTGFQERIIRWLNYFLVECPSVDIFWFYTQTEAEEAVTKDKIVEILLADKISALSSDDDSGDIILEFFPITEEEKKFIFAQYNVLKVPENQDKVIFENIRILLNSEFHGGLNFRDAEDVKEIIRAPKDEPVEAVVTPEPEKQETVAEAAAAAADEIVNKLEVPDQIIPEKTEPEAVDEPETEPEPAIEPEQENESEPEPFHEAATEQDVLKPLADEQETASYLDKEVGELIKQMNVVGQEFEKRLENLTFLKELFKMRDGLIQKAVRYHELRNPDVSELKAKRDELKEIVEKLNELFNNSFYKFVQIENNQRIISRNAITLKSKNFHDQALLDQGVDFLEELNAFHDELTAFDASWEKIDELNQEYKNVFQWFTETVKNIQFGDRFFEKTIFDSSLGSDARIILGSENRHLFDKDKCVDEIIKEMNQMNVEFAGKIRQFEEKRNILLPGIREKVEETIDFLNRMIKQETENTEPEPKTEEKAQAGTEKGESVVVTVDGEPICLTRLQLDSLLIACSWSSNKNMGDGLSKQKLLQLIPLVFPERLIEDFDLDKISEFEENPKQRAPKKEEREKSGAVVIRWRRLNHKLKYLPTHKGYRLTEALRRELRLTEAQHKIIKDFKEEEKLQYSMSYVFAQKGK